MAKRKTQQKQKNTPPEKRIITLFHFLSRTVKQRVWAAPDVSFVCAACSADNAYEASICVRRSGSVYASTFRSTQTTPITPINILITIFGPMIFQFSGIIRESHANFATGIPYCAASACHSRSVQSVNIHEAISEANNAKIELAITVTFAKRVERRPLHNR